MLNATSTRDLNQAARSAAKFLEELGFTLPHAKALDLVARLVGKPHHMAAQAGLPDELVAPSTVPQPVVEAVRQVVFAAGSVPDDKGRVLVTKTDLDALYRVTNQAVGATLASPPAPARPGALATPLEVIEDLCKVLTNRDVEAALFDVGISDAANAALALATPYVSEAVLADFSLDALQEAYDDLPVSVDAEEFSEGHGNWSLNEEEFRQAKRLADALYAGKRQRAEELSTQDMSRLVAQFALVTGQPASIARKYLETKSNLHDEAMRHFKEEHDVELSLGPWLIANDSEKGYWCAGHGWTDCRVSATGYPDHVMQSTSVQQLAAVHGSYSRWVRFDKAFDYDSLNDRA